MSCGRRNANRGALFLALLFILSRATGAGPGEEVPFQLTIETRLVIVPVTVTDARGRFVHGLQREDFLILEEGVPQEVVSCSREEVPLSVVLLVDSSESMLGDLEASLSGVADFIRQMPRRDRAMLVDFDARARMLTSFTSVHRDLLSALETIAADGSTALYDALGLAVARLIGEEGSRVIVLLSDGVDASFSGGSSTLFEEVLGRTHAADVRIYSIGLGVSVSREELQRLARETGGESYFPAQAVALGEVYRDIARRLRNQYVLAYQPKDFRADGRWHGIEVCLRRPEVQVSARRGYYAVRAAAAGEGLALAR